MSAFTPGDLTFNGEEIRALNEAVFEKTFQNPSLSEFHNIVEGIQASKQIVFAGLLGKVGKQGNSCDPTPDTPALPFSEKFWSPVSIQVRLEECWSDLLPSFFAWALKLGLRKADLTGTDWLNFLEDRMATALEEAVHRIAWFADTSEDNVSGGGNITNGVDTTFYTMLDGFFAQIFAGVSGSTIGRYTITENSGGSYAAQALGAGTSLAIFEDLKYNCDFRLRAQDDLVIICTQSIADNWAKYLREQGNDLSYARLESGYNALMFEGIPVIPYQKWDRTIASDFDTGSALYLPHRAVISTPENLNVGCETEGSLTEVDVFYDRKTKNNYVDALFNMDAKIYEDYMIRVAY